MYSVGEFTLMGKMSAQESLIFIDKILTCQEVFQISWCACVNNGKLYLV